MKGKELRIGIVNHFMPESGIKHGGVVQLAHNLAQGLVCRGHKVTVWTYTMKPERALYSTRKLPCQWFVQSWLGLRLTYGLLGNFFFFLPSYKGTDVVLAFGDTALLGLKMRKVVRVMCGSALNEAISARNPVRLIAQLLIYIQELGSAWWQPNTVGISFNSTRSNPFVRRWIHIGIDRARFYPNPELRNKTPTILFVGTLGGRKRGDLLLSWFQRQIQPRFPNAILHMVTENGPVISGVHYHKGISEEELILLYQQSWVYASPSCYEGFGMPYLEAMSCGTPVLATPNPGSCEVLANGEFGILSDDLAFSSNLVDLLSQRELRSKYIERGLLRAEELSFERMLDQYEKLFQNVNEGIGE